MSGRCYRPLAERKKERERESEKMSLSNTEIESALAATKGDVAHAMAMLSLAVPPEVLASAPNDGQPAAQRARAGEGGDAATTRDFKHRPQPKTVGTSQLEEMKRIYKKCEPEDSKEGFDVPDGATFRTLKEGQNIAAFMMLQDLEQFEAEDNFKDAGGLTGKKGALVTRMCKDPDSNIRGASTVLLEEAADDYDYLLLHASTDRPHLVKIYNRAGFEKVGLLPAGSLYDVDTIIFRKDT